MSSLISAPHAKQAPVLIRVPLPKTMVRDYTNEPLQEKAWQEDGVLYIGVNIL